MNVCERERESLNERSDDDAQSGSGGWKPNANIAKEQTVVAFPPQDWMDKNKRSSPVLICMSCQPRVCVRYILFEVCSRELLIRDEEHATSSPFKGALLSPNPSVCLGALNVSSPWKWCTVLSTWPHITFTKIRAHTSVTCHTCLPCTLSPIDQCFTL